MCHKQKAEPKSALLSVAIFDIFLYCPSHLLHRNHISFPLRDRYHFSMNGIEAFKDLTIRNPA